MNVAAEARVLIADVEVDLAGYTDEELDEMLVSIGEVGELDEDLLAVAKLAAVPIAAELLRRHVTPAPVLRALHRQGQLEARLREELAAFSGESLRRACDRVHRLLETGMGSAEVRLAIAAGEARLCRELVDRLEVRA